MVDCSNVKGKKHEQSMDHERFRMIYFAKYETGYRMFQTTTMYNSKHVYMWFQVFFYNDEQFKTFIEFDNVNFRSEAAMDNGCLEYTKEQTRLIDEKAQEMKEDFIAWYLTTGDLTVRTENYNGNERLVNSSMARRFSYYVHWNRRVQLVVSFKEEIPTGSKMKKQRIKCSMSQKHIRVKTILKHIWNDELEIDIAYKMLTMS